MNERIQELHQQAKDYINEVSDDYGTYQGKEYMQAVREKFAELIVRECCRALHPMLRDMISRGHGVDLIKEHFGVE